jgi:hypothetical protein
MVAHAQIRSRVPAESHLFFFISQVQADDLARGIDRIKEEPI